MSGVFNLRPTKPKYKEFWDVSKLLCHLKMMPPVNILTLKLLSYKLATWIILTQASRSHSVKLLTIEGMKKDDSTITMYYSGLLKQCRKGKPNPIVTFKKYTVSHFSYAPLFQGPHFLTKMLESNILYDNLFIDFLSV